MIPSTERKTHVIVFIDRSHKYVPQEKAESLLELSTTNTTGFELNGNYYDFRGVSKILSYKDFCEEYPERVRQERENMPPAYNQINFEDSHEQYMKSGDAVRGLIVGLKKYIAENETTGKAEQKLKKMEQFLLPVT